MMGGKVSKDGNSPGKGAKYRAKYKKYYDNRIFSFHDSYKIINKNLILHSKYVFHV